MIKTYTYASGLFRTGQYDRMYICINSYDYNIRIQILPDGEKAIPNGSNNKCLNDNAVLVYGVLEDSGKYGWIYQGAWIEVFEEMYREAIEARDQKRKEREQQEYEAARREIERDIELLSTYGEKKVIKS